MEIGGRRSDPSRANRRGAGQFAPCGRGSPYGIGFPDRILGVWLQCCGVVPAPADANDSPGTMNFPRGDEFSRGDGSYRRPSVRRDRRSSSLVSGGGGTRTVPESGRDRDPGPKIHARMPRRFYACEAIAALRIFEVLGRMIRGSTGSPACNSRRISLPAIEIGFSEACSSLRSTRPTDS